MEKVSQAAYIPDLQCYRLNMTDKSTAAADVTNSNWKFVAVEICDMLHQVRDSGLEELQKMSDKIQELLSSMNQQTVIIDQLRAEADHQKQVSFKCNAAARSRAHNYNCITDGSIF